jgi:predicted RND superfamily exporter protein
LFIFRSFTGGLLALVPITLTVVMCLGVMGWFD